MGKQFSSQKIGASYVDKKANKIWFCSCQNVFKLVLRHVNRYEKAYGNEFWIEKCLSLTQMILSTKYCSRLEIST